MVARARKPLHRWTDKDLQRLCQTSIPGYDPWKGVDARYRFDLKRARRITLQEWNERPLRERALERAASLLGSQL